MTEEGIFMSKQEQFAYEMICRFQRGEVTREDVANMLETTPRNISRISKRVKEKGMLGIKHGNTTCHRSLRTDTIHTSAPV